MQGQLHALRFVMIYPMRAVIVSLNLFMQYRLTPLNIFSALLLGIELLIQIEPDSIKGQANSYLHFYLIPLAICGFVIDYILQRKIKKYLYLFLSELLIMTIYFLGNTLK